jgi:hypothetical protein
LPRPLIYGDPCLPVRRQLANSKAALPRCKVTIHLPWREQGDALFNGRFLLELPGLSRRKLGMSVAWVLQADLTGLGRYNSPAQVIFGKIYCKLRCQIEYDENEYEYEHEQMDFSLGKRVGFAHRLPES